ncbi:MAG: DUF554 domain-containing protein [Synergistes sp.]|nr:DUF554 domain-containing protein [Synergistes sp.]
MEFLSSVPLFGSMANAVLIAAGSAAGILLRKRLSPKAMELPMQGMSLFVAALGLGMAIKSTRPLIVVGSIAGGSLIGELLGIEAAFETMSKRLGKISGSDGSGFSAGFITASLVYCTGSMAVLGSFEEGLGGYPSLLLTKGLIDGMMSVAMAASLGFGVMLSAIPVFIYQGTLTLAAAKLQPFMSEAAVTEMSAAGGIMLTAIGLNLLGLTKIRVMNMLPAFVLAIFLLEFLH